jgi:pimeloyl-ACP methyl ester carboxylesterase
MATYVLVHGAWVGGWVWKDIAHRLRAKGHEVYTPTLTGLGERIHLLRPGIDLDTHILDVLNVVKFEDLERIVLVGHSYGGMVVTGVADAIPDKIAALVYLDAFVPENGQALLSLVPPTQPNPDRQVQQGDGITLPPLPASAFGVKPEVAAELDKHTNPHPAACFTQPIKLTGGIDRVARRSYIYANDPAPTTFTPFYEKLKNAPGWEMHTLPCTHLVQMDMPAELTQLLLASA